MAHSMVIYKRVKKTPTKNYSRTDLKREEKIMAHKILNERLETVKLNELDENTRASVELIQQGEYTICCNWDEVEKLLDCFSFEDFIRIEIKKKDNETITKEILQKGTQDWEIEELSNGMFAVLPSNTTTQQKNKFKELVRE